MEKTFALWFQELCELAHSRGQRHLIDRSSPEQYREYFEDGDSHDDVILNELAHEPEAA